MNTLSIYYEFLSARKQEGELGADVIKYAGSVFFGLEKKDCDLFWMSEECCSELLKSYQQDKTSASLWDAKIIEYNIHQLQLAIAAIEELKENTAT